MSIAPKVLGEVRRLREDPVYFVQRMFGVTPTEQQVKILRAIAKPGAKVSVSSGHGIGKSTVLAWITLWFVTMYPGCRVPCTAPSGHQLDDVLWAEIAEWHSRMDPAFKILIDVKTKTVTMAQSPKTQFAVARTSRRDNPEALQGFHSKNILFVIDEASGIPEPVFEPVQGALSTPNARIIMTANPTQVVGFFYDSHHDKSHLWDAFELSSEDSPLVSDDYIKEMEEKYGRESDIFRVRVLGKFPRAAVNQLISEEIYNRAVGGAKRVKPDDYLFAPVVLGVDPAWEGNDRSTVYLRQGIYSRLLLSELNVDNMTLASFVLDAWDQFGASACFIDQGWGAGVIDRLRQLGKSPIPIPFGGKPSDVRFADKRTEMWFGLRNGLEDGLVVQHDKDLRIDLMGPQYFTLPSGKIKLESKSDMKKRGLRSPDLGDALALTYAHPVALNHQQSAFSRRHGVTFDEPIPARRQGEFTVYDYHPLKEL